MIKYTNERATNQCWYTVGMYAQYIIECMLGLINSCYYSAGVGRSGTFIALDTEIQRIEKENVIDVYNCVLKMRFWRNFMVQTLVS